jgi:glutathione peroxidase
MYPFLKRFAKLSGTHSQVLKNKNLIKPLTPFESFFAVLNAGQILLMKEWKGKKILIVNTASDCGYTEQYNELQQLHETYGHHIHVIAFPTNDFGEQEKADDTSIIRFCRDNFGVQFPLAKKCSVLPSPQQHPIFRWLSSKEQNGWNDQPPRWNFCKYLINEEGILTHYFDPAISPMSEIVIKSITNNKSR